ncbi:MAG: protein-disulfide reductase DsbD domain-containing protein, partial [Candidatus Aminicenantales bacterium]
TARFSMRDCLLNLRRIVLSAVILAAAALMLMPALAAQTDDQVVEAKTLISRDAVRPGEIFKAAVILKVRAGYHINDNAPLDEFLIPTALVIDANPDFEVLEISFPKGRRARFAYSEAELVIYEGEVILGALLKAKEGLGAGPRTVKGALSYQACNNESCLPPKELRLEIAVPVAASGAGADVHPEIFGQIRFRTLQK